MLYCSFVQNCNCLLTQTAHNSIANLIIYQILFAVNSYFRYTVIRTESRPCTAVTRYAGRSLSRIFHAQRKDFIMKKIKRILALIGVVLLICLYGSTLVFALMDSPAADGLLRASIAATILIPVLLYAYILIARLLKKRRDDQNDHSDIQ